MRRSWPRPRSRCTASSAATRARASRPSSLTAPRPSCRRAWCPIRSRPRCSSSSRRSSRARLPDAVVDARGVAGALPGAAGRPVQRRGGGRGARHLRQGAGVHARGRLDRRRADHAQAAEGARHLPGPVAARARLPRHQRELRLGPGVAAAWRCSAATSTRSRPGPRPGEVESAPWRRYALARYERSSLPAASAPVVARAPSKIVASVVVVAGAVAFLLTASMKQGRRVLQARRRGDGRRRRLARQAAAGARQRRRRVDRAGQGHAAVPVQDREPPAARRPR